MTCELFKARYSAFTDLSDEVFNMHLEEQKVLLSVKVSGLKYQQMIFLLVAHELYLASLGNNAADVIISKSIEGGSATVKNVATNEYQLYYSKSQYGQKFLALKKTIRFVGSVCD